MAMSWGAIQAQTNLLENGGFEGYDCNAAGCSWNDWTMPFGNSEVESSDILEGEAALKTRGNMSGYIDQEIALSDEDYSVGRVFRIELNYKILSIQAESALALDCYWEPKAGTVDADKMKKHDAEVLQRVFANSVSENWENLIIETSKPENSSKIRIRVYVPKKAKVLCDAWSLIETDSIAQEEVTPVDPLPSDTTADWTQEFVWDLSAPLTYLNEGFDRASHNKPLAIDRWQNIADREARPWWGFDEAKTSPYRGEGRYAKATAYQYGKGTTGEWEMWLVTPPLDYTNTNHKVFVFSMMGEYMPDTNNMAYFEVYYIDPITGPEPYFQDLTEFFELPATSEENLIWYTYSLDLTPYSATMAEVFYMAFRYVGPNGGQGAVTYYVDNVSWGADVAEGLESIQKSEVRSQKILRDGQIVIRRDGVEYTVLGVRLH